MRFDSDAVAYFVGCYRGMVGDDFAGEFVAQNMRGCDLPGTDAAMLPEVDVRTGLLNMSDKYEGGSVMG